ncbi:GNAT family N-acetyltransferase [Paractinoplanes durhamensis]|uniref:MarR family transcriptional regulator n=1 Tax=Paractinoplanes durhamensis TaxID=113563 RepID=A0ABQ3YQZ0_9ACTN|nr:GNAT family N-acetyltransferase [Actinoplanes durhamensis]GID99999.1 MarR family transcriptional regulator [Actinoplanes durhamensis]
MIREFGQPGDLGWVVQAHGEIYAREYGYDLSFELMVARIVTDWAGDHDPARAAAWIAELDGRRVGSIFCVGDTDRDTAVLRVLLVEPIARGTGLGGRLVDTCIEFARKAGYRRMTLWTTDSLVAARKLYLGRGFTLAAEEPLRRFGVDVIGQTYELSLVD